MSDDLRRGPVEVRVKEFDDEYTWIVDVNNRFSGAPRPPLLSITGRIRPVRRSLGIIERSEFICAYHGSEMIVF